MIENSVKTQYRFYNWHENISQIVFLEFSSLTLGKNSNVYISQKYDRKLSFWVL